MDESNETESPAETTLRLGQELNTVLLAARAAVDAVIGKANECREHIKQAGLDRNLTADETRLKELLGFVPIFTAAQVSRLDDAFGAIAVVEEMRTGKLNEPDPNQN